MSGAKSLKSITKRCIFMQPLANPWNSSLRDITDDLSSMKMGDRFHLNHVIRDLSLVLRHKQTTSRWRQEAPHAAATGASDPGEREILTGEKRMEMQPESSKPQLSWSEFPPDSLETSQGLLSHPRDPSLCISRPAGRDALGDTTVCVTACSAWGVHRLRNLFPEPPEMTPAQQRTAGMVLVWCLLQVQGVRALGGQISLHGGNGRCRTTPTHSPLEPPLTAAPQGEPFSIPFADSASQPS